MFIPINYSISLNFSFFVSNLSSNVNPKWSRTLFFLIMYSLRAIPSCLCLGVQGVPISKNGWRHFWYDLYTVSSNLILRCANDLFSGYKVEFTIRNWKFTGENTLEFAQIMVEPWNVCESFVFETPKYDMKSRLPKIYNQPSLKCRDIYRSPG